MTFKWVVNAGHGPNTPGKRSPEGMKEYEFNRAVAQYVKEITYAEYEGVEIFFPHSDTRDVPLTERTNYANNIGANCWTGIHANASGASWSTAKGIETFVYPTRPESSYTLALGVQRELIKVTGLTDRGVKTADLHEVRETHMDSILIEAGFMTNQVEVELLKSDTYRRKVAKAIVDSHAAFYGWRKKAMRLFSFHTGGYSSAALVEVHNYVKINKWDFSVEKNHAGDIVFNVGVFGEGTEAAVRFEKFLKDHGYAYQKQYQ